MPPQIYGFRNSSLKIGVEVPPLWSYISVCGQWNKRYDEKFVKNSGDALQFARGGGVLLRVVGITDHHCLCETWPA